MGNTVIRSDATTVVKPIIRVIWEYVGRLTIEFGVLLIRRFVYLIIVSSALRWRSGFLIMRRIKGWNER
jgi:hypothetical protein